MADEQYLTVAQVADELHVTAVTVRRWIANGELPAVKAGPRRWTIRRSDLARFLSADQRLDRPDGAPGDWTFDENIVVPDER